MLGSGGYDAALDAFIRSSVAIQPPLETKTHRTPAEERGRAKLVRENEELKQTLLDAMVEPVRHRKLHTSMHDRKCRESSSNLSRNETHEAPSKIGSPGKGNNTHMKTSQHQTSSASGQVKIAKRERLSEKENMRKADYQVNYKYLNAKVLKQLHKTEPQFESIEEMLPKRRITPSLDWMAFTLTDSIRCRIMRDHCEIPVVSSDGFMRKHIESMMYDMQVENWQICHQFQQSRSKDVDK
ncbi:hypothetical protein GUITHDRAFT_118202 [Guillardia theta CCMP2712]|uniref:Uncharacterized protein n=1 Tax=Guillardia theta (strain CCMP2712) TaxID=905079 RepID=L1IHM2_GUITC|nr:hypothetical protein GUITHDRAFT_118202 [Guillardia theta CCMP2712]EKX35602.1 hypothetical protein GUITHDRAFT_118202 [Guillardia theta CCMP2712]|eukprot:XP_005822582.1 hypothetical protein GUITHDRAFT_118202 [Guillardia theta CCMP2712]